MKIDSATIGMDSARSFTSYAQDITRTGYGNAGRAQGWDTGGYSFSQLLDFAKDGEDAFEKKISANAPRPLFALSETGKSNELTLEGQLEAIREACILFLLRWLYHGYSFQSHNLWPQQSFESEHFYAEVESTSYNAAGIVRTSDGREIDFNLSLSMTRGFCEYTGIRSASDLPLMTDPLVINIDAPISEVSDQKFVFDIDADGTADEISAPLAGSGFLALDQNGDGKINDGSELFGTKSGDGFYDLSRYDEDGNGWIDENDAVFEKLKVWCVSPDGCDRLYTLKETGVGAICLQSAPTDFTLTGQTDPKVNARIRRTGIFLYENGGVGTIQHLDLAQ